MSYLLVSYHLSFLKNKLFLFYSANYIYKRPAGCLWIYLIRVTQENLEGQRNDWGLSFLFLLLPAISVRWPQKGQAEAISFHWLSQTSLIMAPQWDKQDLGRAGSLEVWATVTLGKPCTLPWVEPFHCRILMSTLQGPSFHLNIVLWFPRLRRVTAFYS